MTRGRAASLAVLLVTALVVLLVAPGMRFSTKITAFLPDERSREARIAAMLADSELSRVMILSLSRAPGHEAAALPELAAGLIEHLRTQPDVARVRSGVSEDDIEALLAFTSAWPPTTFVPREAYTDDGVRARLDALREALSSPIAVSIREGAPRDPLGGRWEPLLALRAAQGGELVDEGAVVMSADRAHAFVFVETRSSPFDSTAQRAFRGVLDAWCARTPAVRLQTAGTAQFAMASEAQMKADISRIGTISTIGVLAIFLVLFGSVRMIVLGLVPMVFGSAIALLVCHAVYGEVHGITLAFGTSLLGVGLDYVEHYYTHVALAPAVPPVTMMRRVAPSIALGGLTTVVGFVGIGAAGVPGLQQMAMFAGTAIVAAVVATFVLVPPWMPTRYRPPATIGRIDGVLVRALAWAARRPWTWRGRAIVAAAGGLVTAFALRGAAFTDDVQLLLDTSAAHAAEDRAVRDRLGAEATTFAVVTGADDEALLAAIGRASAELERARGAGLVAAFVPLDGIIPSRAEQLARYTTARAAGPRIRALMDEAGLAPDAFHLFWDALETPPATALALGDVRSSPLAPLVATWLPVGAVPLALIPLFGVDDLHAVRTAVPGATIVAPSKTVIELFRGIRYRTVMAALVGFGVIFALLWARYRSARTASIALAPALLACVVTVGVLASAGVALGILHVMALLLVLSLGVDFGIFLADATARVEEVARTLVSILTAAVSTILSFGLLAASASPGLAALGLTVTIGVTASVACSFLFAAMWARPSVPGDAA